MNIRLRLNKGVKIGDTLAEDFTSFGWENIEIVAQRLRYSEPKYFKAGMVEWYSYEYVCLVYDSTDLDTTIAVLTADEIESEVAAKIYVLNNTD